MGTAIIINDADYSKKNLGSVTQYNKQYHINIGSSSISLSLDIPSVIISAECNIPKQLGTLKTNLSDSEYVSCTFNDYNNMIVTLKKVPKEDVTIQGTIYHSLFTYINDTISINISSNVKHYDEAILYVDASCVKDDGINNKKTNIQIVWKCPNCVVDHDDKKIKISRDKFTIGGSNEITRKGFITNYEPFHDRNMFTYMELATIDTNELPIPGDICLDAAHGGNGTNKSIDGKMFFGKWDGVKQGRFGISTCVKRGDLEQTSTTVDDYTCAENYIHVWYNDGSKINRYYFVNEAGNRITSNVLNGTHVHTVTYDGQLFKLYIDDELIGSVEAALSLKPINQQFYLYDSMICGEYYCLCVWNNYVLSESDIRTNSKLLKEKYITNG